MPELSDFPVEDRGYVQALVSWWLDQEPEFVAMEQIVASKQHRYAGRFDMLYRLPSGELVLGDLKTGKDVRPDKHYRQLMAYRIAWLEMGGEAPQRLQVVNARKDGTYVVGEATGKVTEQSWLATVAQYRAMVEFDELQRKRRRPAPQEQLPEAA
jgi:RecB family exonuclease